jgi:uncharacterized protein involved in exopolysaccharide biosynthesis
MQDGPDRELSFKDYIAVVKRRAMLFFGISAPILTVGIALAFGLPPIYESSGVLLVGQSEVPEYLVRSTVPAFPEERVRMITQRVLTDDNLTRIIEKYDLYPELMQTTPSEALRQMNSSLRVAAEDPASLTNLIGSTANTIAFTVTFSDASPRVARDVASELVSLYLSENQRARQELASDTQDFLAEQARRLEIEIAAKESEIAQFKEQHSGSLPELSNMNMQLLDRTERDVEAVEAEIRSLRERRALFESELAELSPYALVYDQSGNPVLSPRDRLKLLQRSFVQSSAVYSQDHPDVLRIRREIDALSTQTGLPGIDPSILRTELATRTDELNGARERYSADHPDILRLQKTIENLQAALAEAPGARRPTNPAAPPDNPVFIQKRVQLQGTNIDLAAAVERRTQLQERLRSLETRLTTTPEIEREYAGLTRGHEQLIAQFNDATSKLREAQIAVNLETESKGERFTVLNSPAVPNLPAQPNRIAILLLAFAFAFAAGAGAVASAEASDNTVRASRDVQGLLEIPPLVTIPYIDNEADIRSKRWRRLAIATTVLVWVGIAAFFVVNPAG